MTAPRWKFVFTCLALMIPATLSAQGGRAGFFPWWEGPMSNGLDLTDAQRTEIRSVVGEYRGRMREVREAVRKAEGDLDAVFNEDTVDQRKGAEAIDHLTKARADMTKAVSEMSLRMRAVLTPQQWQQLRQRDQRIDVGRGPGPPRVPGRGRREAKVGPAGPKDRSKDSPQRTEGQSQIAPPALNQQ